MSEGAGGATEAERVARAALSRIAEPGSLRMADAVARWGAVEVRDRLLAGDSGDGLRDDLAERLGDLAGARDLTQGDRRGFRFLVPGDAEWPVGLDDLSHVAPLHERGGAPLGLWVRGRLPASLAERSVSIVGSRSATSYGGEVAGSLAAQVARQGYCVVSGAAFGIDQAAHRGALAMDGDTIAVLACGIDRAYPGAHRSLIDHMAEVGAVVSESPPGFAPTRVRFLARNRLIAALTRGTVVVEAAVRSGALNTANWADRLSREVMGVPGAVTSATSQGVHQLIRNGATLVTCADDVLEQLGRSGEGLTAERRAPSAPRDGLPSLERQVLDAVPVLHPAPVDSISRTAGVGVADVERALRSLLTRRLVIHVGTEWRLAANADGS